MFIVFNKQKIYSYIIALSTVVTLFVISFVATNKVENKLIQTSSNEIQENKVEEIQEKENYIKKTD